MNAGCTWPAELRLEFSRSKDQATGTIKVPLWCVQEQDDGEPQVNYRITRDIEFTLPTGIVFTSYSWTVQRHANSKVTVNSGPLHIVGDGTPITLMVK